MSAPAQRLASLDLVRGVAVLGILPVNAAYFAFPVDSAINPAAPPQPVTDESAWTWALTHAVFEFKMITLFSLLFGVSLFLVGGDGDDQARNGALKRRLAWLAAIGVAHGAFIWFGDILLTYSVCGVVAMTMRSWSAPRLLATGGVVAFAWCAAVMALSALQTYGGAIDTAAIARAVAAMRGGLASAMAENVRVWLEYIASIAFYAPLTVALMAFGMGLFKAGFFHAAAPRFLYFVLLGVGAASLAVIAWTTFRTVVADFPTGHFFGFEGALNMSLSLLVALSYAAALILWAQSGRTGWLTAAIASTGRMAFTNYLAQSLIMTTLFWSGRGLGWFGDVDRVGLWGIVVAIWVVQILWSRLWLDHFSVGPLEWGWRRLYEGRKGA